MTDPRQVSDAFRQALFAQESGDALGVLVTFNRTLPNGNAETDRICNQPGGLVSRSNTYAFHPMGVRLPESSPSSAPKARLKIDFVDRTIGTRLRSALKTTADVELVLASDPDTVEISWTGIDVGSLKWNVLDMNIDLVRKDGKSEPYPVPSFTPSVTPGAH